jgi:hypothetical protein
MSFVFFFEKRVHPLFEKKNAKITRKKSELQERNKKTQVNRPGKFF